jgi:hypothetical protein
MRARITRSKGRPGHVALALIKTGVPRQFLVKSGPSKAWLKIKNPKAPAATRVIDGTF